jgi:uncharacterized membrane protein (DUF2068 family)
MSMMEVGRAVTAVAVVTTLAFTTVSQRGDANHAHPPGELPLVLRFIAAFKFSQAITLIGVALAAFQLLRPEIAALVQQWVDTLPISSEQNAVQHFVGWTMGLAPHQVMGIGFGALLYALLFLVEGIGLWARKAWAEWLTVIATGLPIPLELWEVTRHVSPLGIAALVANVTVVWLLARHLRQKQARIASDDRARVPQPR